MAKELKKMTAAELREQGIVLAKAKTHIDYSKEDGSANAKKKLSKLRNEGIAFYKRIMLLADGQFTHDGEKYPVTVSEAQRDWLLNPLADLHEAALQALETGTRPKVVTEVCPD